MMMVVQAPSLGGSAEPRGSRGGLPHLPSGGDAAPSIDVLIPAFNAAHTIRQAVESIQGQTVCDIVIHVVDDGSSDATPLILAELAANDARIRIHRKANGGIVDALNYGLKFCTAALIARHDADDIAYPDRLAVQASYLADRPDVLAVGSAVRHVDEAGIPTNSIARLDPPECADLFAVPAREPYLIHPFLMVRRAAVEAVGGYRHAHHAEDTDLYWRLLERGKLHNLDDVLGDYRMHGNSISGASIVNGRVMAIGSQLASFSARRRRVGKEDLPFRSSQLAELQKAGSLEAMVAIAAEPLDAAERPLFAEAVAAKLLELASYRPYELERSDCRFVRMVADRGFAHLAADSRALQIRRVTGAGARIAAAGRPADALLLVPRRLFLPLVMRWLFRQRCFTIVRRHVARARNAPVK